MQQAKTKQGYSAEYTYDANGNRLTRTVNNVTEVYEYDDADKLLSVSVGENPVKEYSYDACGRLIAVESSAGVTSLSWDYEDRLIGITYPNQSTNSFGYNPFGARVSKSDSSGTSTYFRAGTSVVSPVLSDGSAIYTPGISERRNNNSTYYHSDLKNTTAQTASNETVSGTNQYDAFGNVIDYSGNWNGPFAYGGAFGYQSDDDSGLMLLGHRYYDPSTGRFLSRDPIGDGANWYAYCGNNPLKFVDYFGLYKVVVRGDDEAVPLSGLGYWWTKPSTNPRQGDKEMYRPSRNEVVSNLIGATYFYFWGHGRGGGSLVLGEEELTLQDVFFIGVIRRLLGRPKMKKAELRACKSVSTAAALNAWLLIAEEVEGYTGLTGELIGGLIPVIYRSHSFTQPVIDDPKGNINDKISKKNDKKSGAVTKKNSKLRKK